MTKMKTKEAHISRAILRGARVSPRKARLVIDLVRGLPVERALEVLLGSCKKTSPIVSKLILSAVANAKQSSGVDMESLFIKSAWVDEGPTLNRFMPRAQGRATPIRKRSSHINIILDEMAA